MPWQTPQHAAGLLSHVCSTLIKTGFADLSRLCNKTCSLVAFFHTYICRTKIGCFQWRFIAHWIFAFEKQQADKGMISELLFNHRLLWFVAAIMFLVSHFCWTPQVWSDSYISKRLRYCTKQVGPDAAVACGKQLHAVKARLSEKKKKGGGKPNWIESWFIVPTCLSPFRIN